MDFDDPKALAEIEALRRLIYQHHNPVPQSVMDLAPRPRPEPNPNSMIRAPLNLFDADRSIQQLQKIRTPKTIA